MFIYIYIYMYVFTFPSPHLCAGTSCNRHMLKHAAFITFKMYTWITKRWSWRDCCGAVFWIRIAIIFLKWIEVTTQCSSNCNQLRFKVIKLQCRRILNNLTKMKTETILHSELRIRDNMAFWVVSFNILQPDWLLYSFGCVFPPGDGWTNTSGGAFCGFRLTGGCQAGICEPIHHES